MGARGSYAVRGRLGFGELAGEGYEGDLFGVTLEGIWGLEETNLDSNWGWKKWKSGSALFTYFRFGLECGVSTSTEY